MDLPLCLSLPVQEDEAIANSIQEVSLLAKASDDRWLLKEGNFVEEDPNVMFFFVQRGRVLLAPD